MKARGNGFAAGCGFPSVVPVHADGSCVGPLAIGGQAGCGVNGVTYPDLPVFEDVGP